MISKKMLLDNTGKDISAKLKKMNYNLITYLKNDNDKSISELISGNIQEFEDENIINIKQYLFRECRELTKVNLPKCTNVGEYAFMYCTSLENVNLPECVDANMYAFAYCEKLKQFNAPKVTQIEYSGLVGCISLLSVELPECITVSDRAFAKCTALTAVILRSPTVCRLENSEALYNTPIANGTGYIYVPDALVNDYKKATNWSVYANQIKPLSEYIE